MKFSKNAKRIFASSLAGSLLLSIAAVNSIPAAFAAGGRALADDSLLVVLNQHANSSSAQASLSSEAKAKTLTDMHSEVRDYSVLQVQGPTGQRETTFANIKSMMKSHPEIKSVSRNYLRHRMLGSHAASNGGVNDPGFSTQWPLANMRWSAARALYGTAQGPYPARVTILSQGVNPVTTNSELGAAIKQYNAVNPNFAPFIVPVSGVAPPTGAEGDLDASLPGCLTDNGFGLAGAACFQAYNPCHEVMFQITNTDFASDAQIANAVLFRINQQKRLGGPGPVNLSFGSGTPNAILIANAMTPWTAANPENGDPPLWEASFIQEAGLDLLEEGSIFVLAAGDNVSDGRVGAPDSYQAQVFNPTLPLGSFPDPAPGNVVVVQASANDSNNKALLTQVVGDPVYAPGDFQPAFIGGQIIDDFYGSSFSAPQWCSCIALMMSINHHLTAAQANTIMINTGTAGSGVAPDPNGGTPTNPAPTTNFIIPAFDRAIGAAL